jgi:hypothetical protein
VTDECQRPTKTERRRFTSTSSASRKRLDVVSEFDARSSGQEVPNSDRVPVLPPKRDGADAETTPEAARPVDSA